MVPICLQRWLSAVAFARIVSGPVVEDSSEAREGHLGRVELGQIVRGRDDIEEPAHAARAQRRRRRELREVPVVKEVLGHAGGETLSVEMTDWGATHDPASYEEPPEELPERGMGLFIMRSCMDELAYVPGPPNTLILRKRWR